MSATITITPVEGRLLAVCTLNEDGSCGMDWSIEIQGLGYSLVGIDEFLKERESDILGAGKHNITIPNAIVDGKAYKVTVDASEVNNIALST
mmetsp:Transcript_42847/g.48684  ORF Transcript_42847/g.48684 Transcript_42847/m.48684 type:complete len:92 (+) Transcript_42847:170-445(+)